MYPGGRLVPFVTLSVSPEAGCAAAAVMVPATGAELDDLSLLLHPTTQTAAANATAANFDALGVNVLANRRRGCGIPRTTWW